MNLAGLLLGAVVLVLSMTSCSGLALGPEDETPLELAIDAQDASLVEKTLG